MSIPRTFSEPIRTRQLDLGLRSEASAARRAGLSLTAFAFLLWTAHVCVPGDCHWGTAHREAALWGTLQRGKAKARNKRTQRGAFTCRRSGDRNLAGGRQLWISHVVSYEFNMCFPLLTFAALFRRVSQDLWEFPCPVCRRSKVSPRWPRAHLQKLPFSSPREERVDPRRRCVSRCPE